MNTIKTNQDPTEKFKVCKNGSKRRKNDDYGGRIMRSTGRHSKVCTVRGPKDRRLRLSPETAILFYDVQERLGVDGPSEAIDWLIKEAKSAIDALEQPASNVAIANTNYFKTEIGIIQNTEHLNNPISSFGLFSQAEILDSNLEVARLQRILSWDYNSCVPPPLLHFPTPVDSGHGYMFTDREPLQSRFSLQFPAVNFSHEELLNFTKMMEGKPCVCEQVSRINASS